MQPISRPNPKGGRPLARGFTLVEMLVVLGILGVILVATIPSINKYLPRYRLDRTAENLAQAIRIARNGAVAKHCNLVLRLWTDENRTVPAVAGGVVRAYDILVDRNNNIIPELPPAGTDAILRYPFVYRDVQILLDPDAGGVAVQQPYPSFPDAPAPFIVFRPDGAVYDYQAGTFVPIDQLAFLVESFTLPDFDNSTAQIAEYKYRWVEVDRLGAVRMVGLQR